LEKNKTKTPKIKTKAKQQFPFGAAYQRGSALCDGGTRCSDHHDLHFQQENPAALHPHHPLHTQNSLPAPADLVELNQSKKVDH